jgi:hypothetical protein
VESSSEWSPIPIFFCSLLLNVENDYLFCPGFIYVSSCFNILMIMFHVFLSSKPSSLFMVCGCSHVSVISWNLIQWSNSLHVLPLLIYLVNTSVDVEPVPCSLSLQIAQVWAILTLSKDDLGLKVAGVYCVPSECGKVYVGQIH